MQNEISLSFFWKCFKKCWFLMIIFGIVVALIAGIFTNFLPKKYSSSVDFYIINTNTSYDYTTSALLSASSYLINDYIELIRSDAILSYIAEDVNEGKPEEEHITPKQIRAMITSSSTDTSLFTIKVSSTDPHLALEIADAIERIAPGEVTSIAKPDRVTNENIYNALLTAINESVAKQNNVSTEDIKGSSTINDAIYNELLTEINKNRPEDEQMSLEQLKETYKINESTYSSIANAINNGNFGYEKMTMEELKENYTIQGLNSTLDCFKTVNVPVLDTTPDSPDVTKTAVVAGGACAVLVYLFFLIKKFIEMRISSEDDIKAFINHPLVGTIPHWGSSAKK